VQEVPGSNPGGPTKFLKELQTADLYEVLFWSPTGVQNGRRGGSPPVQSELTAPDFAQALSSYINPTFPTIGTEAIDSFSQLLVGLITGRSDFPT